MYKVFDTAQINCFYIKYSEPSRCKGDAIKHPWISSYKHTAIHQIQFSKYTAQGIKLFFIYI